MGAGVIGQAEATIVVVSAFAVGLAAGWLLGWFRGYTICTRERRRR